jgi:hypothetical protein
MRRLKPRETLIRDICSGFVRRVRPGLYAAQKEASQAKSAASASKEVYAIASLFPSHRFKTNQGRKLE